MHNIIRHPKLIFLTLLIALCCGQSATAQVSGLSYTLSPTGSYTWWDSKSGLDDGFLVGANIGLGFGEFVELRGTYAQSLSQKTSFSDFGFDGIPDTAFMSRDVDLTRYGGELKFNLSRGKLLPYLTLGAGIQETKLDTFANNKVIYASAGLGITLSAADRYTFTIEGKSTAYNYNAVRNLLTTGDRTAFDLDPATFDNERLNNLSINASLAFYLGGRRPGQLTDVDRAYQQAFGNGFKNLSILLEPTVSHISFDDMLPFRDTWLGGANIGTDFGPLVGIRGYYLQGMSEDNINLDFDDIAVYGGDFRFKLNNVASGLAPFVTVGGGYINVKDSYIARDTMGANSQAFAAGGGGIVLGLGRNLQLRGSAKALLTSGQNVEDLQTTDQITTSMQYSFGINLALGKKAQSAEAIIASRSEAAVTAQNAVNAQETEKLRMEYEAKVAALQTELNEAYAKEDVEKAADLIEEVEEAEAVVSELKVREQAYKNEEERARAQRLAVLPTSPAPAAAPVSPYGVFPSGGRIVLTAAEFENLIDEILENMGGAGQRLAPVMQPEVTRIAQADNSQQFRELENKLGDIERMLVTLTERQKSATEADGNRQDRAREEARRDMTEFSARLLREMRKIQDEIDNLDRKVDRNARQGFSGAGDDRRDDSPATDRRNNDDDFRDDDPARNRRNRDEINITRQDGFLAGDTSRFSRIRYAGMSGFAGFNLGSAKNNTLNVGARWHYTLGNKGGIELMPEAFFGFGSPSNFGLSANILKTFNVDKVGFIKPYVGTGFGFMQIGVEDEDKLRGVFNVIIGSYLNVAGGRLYVDLTGRNLFKNNQLIAGYRFAF